MVLLQFDDLDSAVDWVSAGEFVDACAYVSRADGQVYLKSAEPGGFDGGDEELPEDIDDETRYATVPHKNDLDLGRHLVMAFVDQCLPDESDRVRAIFSRRGAYARFKDLLDRKGQLQQWYDFESDATAKALQEWAQENGFELSPPPARAAG